jgi:methylated-DNA-[protein]-cysteine S-methyltransferase
MQKAIKYTIFKTEWGYFGLAGAEGRLLASRLPIAEYETAKSYLLKGLENARCDRMLFRELAEQITAYFEGSYVDFDKDIPVIFDRLSGFARGVLTACRDVSFGETISYGGLAERVGRPGAARAVGRVMANNPLPLIIPCHRVIYSNGGTGGFGAIGGVKLKKRMLELEIGNFLKTGFLG